MKYDNKLSLNIEGIVGRSFTGIIKHPSNMMFAIFLMLLATLATVALQGPQ